LNPYIPNTERDRQEMLKRIGVSSFEELLASIPPEVRLRGTLRLPPPLSEMEVTSLLARMSEENRNADQYTSFLGAGVYDHFIPAAVNHIVSRPEFYTAYTPYQAEVSQGTLQAIYEFQSLICELTGMDISNASMYDGGSALAEAALMAIHHHRSSGSPRLGLVISAGVHPHYLKILRTYTRGLGAVIIPAGAPSGSTDLCQLEAALSDGTAAVLIQSPNFFGCLEDLAPIAQLAHKKGTILIVAVDPISLGILARPGDLGADIVVGEGQGLGIPMSFGGPLLGIMACRRDLRRLLPGRVVGATVDKEGRRGYVLTLQTREQHIRRERATSNICTNEALCALAATVYLSLMGKHGLKHVASLCLQKSHYLAERISATRGFSLRFSAPFFKEFVVRTPIPPREVLTRLLERSFFAGVDLGRFGIGLDDSLLLAVTEKRTREDLDRFADALAAL
jgi:glycine dehydrogenase subunit 1